MPEYDDIREHFILYTFLHYFIEFSTHTDEQKKSKNPCNHFHIAFKIEATKKTLIIESQFNMYPNGKAFVRR